MTIEEALHYIHCNNWQKSSPGPARMRALMAGLGNPQARLRFVHVAGTNGKGSVCAMLDSVLQAAGFRTGLFTSPYLRRFHERMRVDGTEITDAELIALTERVKPVVEAMTQRPTEFELITAMAFCHFADKGCDPVVLEVGLGGRLDPTNVISAPMAAVITAIGLDHTELLGTTLSQIASEKAGIIKGPHGVILAAQSPEVIQVVNAACIAHGAALRVSSQEALRLREANLDGQTLDYRDWQDLHLGLLGDYQLQNAALALDTLETLRELGLAISEDAVRRGLAQARWPGRFEVLRRSPLTLADGAHNPNGMQELTRCLDRYVPGEKLIFLVGIMADKDYITMLRLLTPYARAFVTAAPHNPRALSAQCLRQALSVEFSGPVLAVDSVEAGLRQAIDLQGEDGLLCICGSLYLLGEARQFFED